MNTPVITFPENYYQRVKEGDITQVVRPASQKLYLSVYDWIPIVFKGSNDSVMVEIEDINFTSFKNLNLDTAMKCGFGSVNELKSDLKKTSLIIYPFHQSSELV